MRPSYAWHTLWNRLMGLAQKGETRLRVDYQTHVWLAAPKVISVSLYEHEFARITPGSVEVWYSQQNPILHRRLNEALRPVGWAVVERDGAWSLIKRENDGGLAHPFPRDVKATVGPREDVPTYRVGAAL